MNNPIEAYDFTLGVLEELKVVGIKVIYKPSNSRTSESAVKKYGSNPHCVPPELWYNIILIYETQTHIDLIHNKLKYLRLCGISFDTGGCKKRFDWELDWSFYYTKGQEDWEGIENLEELKDMVTKLNNNEKDE